MITISFILYCVVTFLIGYLAYRRTHTLSDYILGGRRLSSWVSAISACASDMSGWLLLGLPGYAYLSGVESGWIAIGLIIGTYLNWRLVAYRLRIYSYVAGDSHTLPEFFQNRFQDTTPFLRVIAASFILLFYLFYTSSGLVAGGKLFNAVFDLPYHWAVSIGTLVIVIYVFIGGFLAVSWTDVFQGLLMAAALLVVPLIVFVSEGGIMARVGHIQQINPALLDMMSNAEGKSLGFATIISLMAWGLGYFGQPHILARFKAIHSARAIPAARRIAISWVVLTLCCAILVGLAGIDYFPTPLQGADSEKIFILLVQALFHPLVAGICLAAIMAAIMSTADSQLLVSAAALTNDIYRKLVRKEASTTELVWIGRVTVFIVALIALMLAWDPERKVLDLVAYAWAGFGAAFGPVLLLSLYWRRMTYQGAIAGIITGGLTVVIWKPLQGGLFDLYEIIPGFVLATIVSIVMSYISPTPNDAVLEVFDKATAKTGSSN